MFTFRNLIIFTACLSLNLHAATDETTDAYFDLDLEDLLSMEITSVSKKKQRLSEAAAAIFVITNEDIKRSGVTTIADALRLAPGIQVARIDSNKWAVSSRGFNAQFANKLLVLMDGRSVYTSSYSGVYWEDQDTILEDIDRIEVIRGPGATLWGANAVNGVINIITKSSSKTQGSLYVVGGGDEEKFFTHFRKGFAIGEDLSGRFYLKLNQRDSTYAPALDAEAGDEWQSLRGGFRIDTDTDNASSWTLQGDVYKNDLNQIVKSLWLDPFDPDNAPPYQITNIDDAFVSRGYNLLGRWQYQAGDSNYTLQTYFDHTYRSEEILKQEIDTFDIDFQHQYQGFDGHDLVWGLGYRRIEDSYNNTYNVSIENTDNLEIELVSAFIQDEIVLDDDLRLTLGSKFEENEYTGTEIQPNVRISWLPKPGHTLWSSLSRAVRTPSAVERRGSLATGVNHVPLIELSVDGSEAFDSEKLTAFEIGYRLQPTEQTSVDIALFYNQYEDVGTFEVADTVFGNPIRFEFDNKRDVLTNGIEVIFDWFPREDWKIQTAYTFVDVDDDVDADSTDNISANLIGGSTPEHHLTIRSAYDYSERLSLDVWLYYVDELDGSAYSVSSSTIEDYTSLNLKLNWRPEKHMELSLVGHNLNNDRHAEFVGENFISVTEIERSAYVQLKLEF